MLKQHHFTSNVPNASPAGMLRPGAAHSNDFLYSPEVTGAARDNLFAKVALVQDSIYRDRRFKHYFERISSAASGDFRFDIGDFRTNGVFLPTRAADALRLGVALYDGQEDATDEFMEQRILEIMERGQRIQSAIAAQGPKRGAGLFQALRKTLSQEKPDGAAADFATQFMAKEHRIAMNFKKLAVQEGGIPEANLPAGATLLLFCDSDPRNTGKAAGFAKRNNAATASAWTMNYIAGTPDIDSYRAQ